MSITYVRSGDMSLDSSAEVCPVSWLNSSGWKVTSLLFPFLSHLFTLPFPSLSIPSLFCEALNVSSIIFTFFFSLPYILIQLFHCSIFSYFHTSLIGFVLSSFNLFFIFFIFFMISFLSLLLTFIDSTILLSLPLIITFFFNRICYSYKS